MMIRYSTACTAENWAALAEIAHKTGSLFQGRPSWRVLLRKIATGELVVGTTSESLPQLRTKPSDFAVPTVQVATNLRPEHTENLKAFWPPGKPEPKPKKGPKRIGALPHEDQHWGPPQD